MAAESKRHPLARLFEYVFRYRLALVFSVLFSTIFAFFATASIAALIPVLRIILRENPREKIRDLADDVPDATKRERHRVLSELQLGISLELNRALVGTDVEVLAEGVSRHDQRRFTGRTPTGRIAAFTSDTDPTGRIVKVRVDDATALVLLGRAVRSSSGPDLPGRS